MTTFRGEDLYISPREGSAQFNKVEKLTCNVTAQVITMLLHCGFYTCISWVLKVKTRAWIELSNDFL